MGSLPNLQEHGCAGTKYVTNTDAHAGALRGCAPRRLRIGGTNKLGAPLPAAAALRRGCILQVSFLLLALQQTHLDTFAPNHPRRLPGFLCVQGAFS